MSYGSLIRLGPVRRRKARRRVNIQQRLVDFARDLVRRPTRAEALLARALDDLGVPFQFQRPRLDRRRGLACIIDFSLPRKVLVEVDGGYHTTDDQMAKDWMRDDALYWAGFRVLRFTNDEVFSDARGVAFQVAVVLGERGYTEVRAVIDEILRK